MATMAEKPATTRTINLLSKIGFGILLPAMIFVAYQFILIIWTDHSGSYDGALIIFGFLGVPGLMVAGCWVIPNQWGRRGSVFLAGLLIPAVVGAVEFFWLWAPINTRVAIGTTIGEPYFVWMLWLFGFLMFVPLFISIAYAIRRRLQGEKK